MKIIGQRARCLVLLAAVSLTLAICWIGCRRQASTHTELHLYFQENLKTLDPVNADDQFSSIAISQIYEAPMQYRYNGNRIDEVEPLLLTTLPDVSADGRTVTLTFQKNL